MKKVEQDLLFEKVIYKKSRKESNQTFIISIGIGLERLFGYQTFLDSRSGVGRGTSSKQPILMGRNFKNNTNTHCLGIGYYVNFWGA